MQRKLKDLVSLASIPGASIAIANGHNKIKSSQTVNNIETYQAGVTDLTLTKKQLITAETIFEAASLSKPVFAYIVLKQIEKGLFSKENESPESGLDQPLYELYKGQEGDGFGPPPMREHENYKLLTARLLLSHLSGLPNEFAENEEYAAAVKENFIYSGEAYRFLNEVLEFVTKKNLATLSQEIFKQLEMHNSSFIPYLNSPLVEKNRAIGHDNFDEKDTSEHFPPKFPPHPAASLITTASDYAKFLQACTKDKFINKHMFENMFATEEGLSKKDVIAIKKGVPFKSLSCLGWGLGIGLQKINEDVIAFHWGDVNTNRSFCAINLTTNNAVVCLTNSSKGPLIFKEIAEPVVGDLSHVFTWLKLKENLPINFKEVKLLTSSPLKAKSIFWHDKELSLEQNKRLDQILSKKPNRPKGG